MHKKWSCSLRISLVNMIKSAGNCRFGHIYWEILNRKLHFLCSVGSAQVPILLSVCRMFVRVRTPDIVTPVGIWLNALSLINHLTKENYHHPRHHHPHYHHIVIIIIIINTFLPFLNEYFLWIVVWFKFYTALKWFLKDDFLLSNRTILSYN